MSTQFELRTIIPDEMADLLDGHFFEIESAHWGVMQKEINDPYEVFGIFADAETAQAALAKLRIEFPTLPESFTETIIEDADWQNAYKEFVKPWSDRQLHWIPLWERDKLEVPADAAVVYLDAGMAFGTGAHETTRLCARRLQDYRDAHTSGLNTLKVIDAGCGSGVLALSASVLGFKKILGFDFDPEAIVVCESNAEENPHITKLDFEVADLEDGLKDRQADLLLANIQTDVLIPHSDPVVHGVKSGGTLALSGILVKELDLVRAHYQAKFAELRAEDTISVDSRQDGEWGDLRFVLS
ncbi:MAG: methyltransferase domain-containing protein [Opitutae bacterium]|jgi:ribosomal protein L11 methyltransferase|nr:methyltransferase domain-containing protein [Opitutae bacterium]